MDIVEFLRSSTNDPLNDWQHPAWQARVSEGRLRGLLAEVYLWLADDRTDLLSLQSIVDRYKKMIDDDLRADGSLPDHP